MKPGYKQTEVGVIPEEWQVKPLGEGINLLSGHHVLAHHCNTEGRGNPYITGPADFPNGVIKNTKFTEKPSTLCRQGDILVTVKGSGAGTIVLADSEYCISRQLMAIRVSDWDTGYVYESLRRDASLFGAAATGLIPGLSRGDILDKKLASPPLPEQRAIATALSDVDGLLGGLDRLIAKKRDLKQAAMQQLLTGQTRLPGRHGEWELKRLGEIAHIKTGSRNNEDKVEDGQYPFFVRSEVVERINSYSHDCEAILVPGEGRIGDIFHYINGRFDVHQRVYAITKFSADISGRFIHFYLAKNFGAWAMQNTVKATVDSLRLPTFQIFEMRLPPTKAEQTAIASVLTEMDRELAVLEQRREKTRALKQAMMQELLTGRTRLISTGVTDA